MATVGMAASAPVGAAARIEGPAGQSPAGQRFSEVLGTLPGKELTGPPRAAQPLVRALDGLEAGRRRLDAIIAQANAGRSFRPAELLALQAEVHQIGEEIALTQRLAEEGLGSLRRLWSMQL